MSRVLAVGMVAGAIVSATGPAFAADDKPAPKGKDCVVENVDDNGNTVSTSTVPEGTVVGVFHCSGGEWKFGWYPFDAFVSGTAGPLAVNTSGLVEGAVLNVDTREGKLAVREIQSVVEKAFDEPLATPDKAIVVADRGTDLSAGEIEALLAGKDVDGVKLLATVQPKPEHSINDLNDSADSADASARKVIIRLGGGWVFVGDITCKRNSDGTLTCKITGKIIRS
jgi:hypothetical protein